MGCLRIADGGEVAAAELLEEGAVLVEIPRWIEDEEIGAEIDGFEQAIDFGEVAGDAADTGIDQRAGVDVDAEEMVIQAKQLLRPLLSLS